VSEELPLDEAPTPTSASTAATGLLRGRAGAREEDATTVSAEVLTDDSALLALLSHFGSVHTEVSGSTTTATLRLPSNPDIER
jgi:hypothetical protein